MECLSFPFQDSLTINFYNKGKEERENVYFCQSSFLCVSFTSNERKCWISTVVSCKLESIHTIVSKVVPFCASISLNSDCRSNIFFRVLGKLWAIVLSAILSRTVRKGWGETMGNFFFVVAFLCKGVFFVYYGSRNSTLSRFFLASHLAHKPKHTNNSSIFFIFLFFSFFFNFF